MNKRRFIPGKYTWLASIVLLALAVDIFTHKGIIRALLPSGFTAKRSPVTTTSCERILVVTGKKWVKAVNTFDKMKTITADIPGIEMDVYFDTAKNQLLVYHDSSSYSTTAITDLLKQYSAQQLKASVWLDFKNLSSFNQVLSLQYILSLQKEFHLENKILIESSQPALLTAFCQHGFFTSYYVPYFNPYLITENNIEQYIDTIAANLRQYPASALSGYYFQYPLLRKFFPSMPVLLWVDKPGFSLVANLFEKRLLDDGKATVILHP